MSQPPDHLLRFARGAMGLDADWQAIGTESEQARVWFLSYENEPLAIMKFHRHLDAAIRETNFYQSWSSELSGRVPRWFGQCPREPRAMLLGVVEGHRVEGDGSTRVQTKAGRFLGSLHTIAYLDHDELGPEHALKQRFDSAIERASGLVDDAILNAIIFPDSMGLRLRRVPCHRDFGPHNWLVRGSEERLSVIDFGQARPDVFLSDLVKLVPVWSRSEDHLVAFLKGYGRLLTSSEWRLLRIMVGQYAIGSLVWGQKNAQSGPVAEGQTMLDVFNLEAWWSAQIGSA